MLDLPAIEALLEERSSLRATRQWNAADAIRTQLWEEFGVEVNDEDRRWRLDPERDPSTRAQPTARAPPKPQPRDFGALGHDYSRAEDDDASLREGALDSINELLRERLEAKMARRFQAADVLLEELDALYGVQVNDGRKQWRADGGAFGMPPYRRRGGGGRVDEERVASLLEERAAARRQKRYADADQIAERLHAESGVVIDDERRTWEVEGRHGGYVRVGDPPAGADVAAAAAMDEEVGSLLARRSEAKRRRSYEEADELQERVRELAELDNRNRTWRYPPAGQARAPPARRPRRNSWK